MFQRSLLAKSFQIFMTSNIRQSQSINTLACVRQDFAIQVGSHQKAQKKSQLYKQHYFFLEGNSFSKTLKLFNLMLSSWGQGWGAQKLLINHPAEALQMLSCVGSQVLCPCRARTTSCWLFFWIVVGSGTTLGPLNPQIWVWLEGTEVPSTGQNNGQSCCLHYWAEYELLVRTSALG